MADPNLQIKPLYPDRLSATQPRIESKEIGFGNIFASSLLSVNDPATFIPTPGSAGSTLLMQTESNSTLPEAALSVVKRVQIPAGAMALAV